MAKYELFDQVKFYLQAADPRKQKPWADVTNDLVDGKIDIAILWGPLAGYEAKKAKKPSLIACKTIIGFGSPNKQGKNSSHGAPLGEDEIKRTKKKINWNYPDFFVPKNIVELWKELSIKGIKENKKWIAISALTGKNMDELKKIIGRIFQNNKLQNNKNIGVKAHGN